MNLQAVRGYPARPQAPLAGLGPGSRRIAPMAQTACTPPMSARRATHRSTHAPQAYSQMRLAARTRILRNTLTASAQPVSSQERCRRWRVHPRGVTGNLTQMRRPPSSAEPGCRHPRRSPRHIRAMPAIAPLGAAVQKMHTGPQCTQWVLTAVQLLVQAVCSRHGRSQGSCSASHAHTARGRGRVRLALPQMPAPSRVVGAGSPCPGMTPSPAGSVASSLRRQHSQCPARRWLSSNGSSREVRRTRKQLQAPRSFRQSRRHAAP